MKCKIIPTVFAIKEDDFLDRLQRLLKISKDIQIDFMDGRFVHSNFINFDIIPDLKKYKKHNFEAHLMTLNPEKYIEALKEKGFKKIIFHFEAYNDSQKAIGLADKIKKNKMKAYLAFNPDTKIIDILSIAKEFDGILFMGVYPGKEHQMFLYDVLEHIKHLRHFDKKIDIQVDGGVNSSNISYIAKAGANLFNTGSYVSESVNPKAALNKLKKEIK